MPIRLSDPHDRATLRSFALGGPVAWLVPYSFEPGGGSAAFGD
jgi:hypothetical protein